MDALFPFFWPSIDLNWKKISIAYSCENDFQMWHSMNDDVFYLTHSAPLTVFHIKIQRVYSIKLQCLKWIQRDADKKHYVSIRDDCVHCFNSFRFDVVSEGSDFAGKTIRETFFSACLMYDFVRSIRIALMKLVS